MSRPCLLAGLLAAALAWSLQGCATAGRDLEPGDYWPSGERWRQAGRTAIASRGTWVPLIGAGLVSIDDWDEEISDWAAEHTPVFGSREDASDASDTLRELTRIAMVGTVVAVPSGDGAWEWRPERLLLEVGATQVTELLTRSLKDATGRERPDGSNDRSFPSGHASQSAVAAALACRNVDQIPGLANGWGGALKVSFRVLAAGSAWARVEAGVHYPSDVLFGAALGNFVAVLLHDAFLPAEPRVRFTAVLDRDEVSFTVLARF